jgi:hypothetical protein
VAAGQLTALVAFVAIVALVAVVGIRLGMLLAPHIGRWADRTDEEDRGDDD